MRRPSVLLIKSRSVASKVSGSTPPLGLLYIAACLRKSLGAEVRLIDAALEADPLKAVGDAVRTRKPDVAGISALTAEAFPAHALAAAVKAEGPAVPVVMGGPYPSADPELALKDPNVDAAVIGEGEETFTELTRLLTEEGRAGLGPAALRAVKGVAFRCGSGVELSAPREPIRDLDALPFPAWDLIDYRKFWTRPSMASLGIRPYLTMFTSRGCPYRCVFCHQLFGKTFRARSPESVADEAAEIKKLGAGHIEVLDDIANFDPDRFDRMLGLLLERDLRPVLSFPNAVRADLLRESSVDLLKRVGAGEVSVAVETASERLQKLLNKNLSPEKAWRAIDLLVSKRIFTRGFFMLGLPTETEAEMRSTIRFAHASRLHLALFFTPNPFRNTGLYGMFAGAGKLPAGARTVDFEYYGAPFNGSEVPDRRYRMLYRWAYYGFYFDPRRIWRIARDRPFLSDIPARAYKLLRNVVSFRRLKEPGAGA